MAQDTKSAIHRHGAMQMNLSAATAVACGRWHPSFGMVAVHGADGIAVMWTHHQTKVVSTCNQIVRVVAAGLGNFFNWILAVD